MTLAEDMRWAADVLEAASGLYEAIDASKYPWTAQELREEAVHVEADSAV